METLDLEFDAWCEKLLMAGVNPSSYLFIKSQCRFVWDACRCKCADLCFERGHADLSMAIRKNEDGELIEG